MDAEHRLALFSEVTDIYDLEYCRNILENFNWNVESAVNYHILNGSSRSPTGHILDDRPPALRISDNGPPASHISNQVALSSTGHVSASSNSDSSVMRVPPSFIDDYDEFYGSEHPDFFRGTCRQAVDEARKKSKIMLVYLHVEEERDAERFCVETLSERSVIEYIDQNCLLWACYARPRHGIKYPLFIVVLANPMRLVEIQGFLPADQFLQRLQSIVSG